MIGAPEIDLGYSLTDGAIAVNNLESVRQRSWNQFWRDPLREGIAESIVEQEQWTAQFVGDPARPPAAVHHRSHGHGIAQRLIRAQVASWLIALRQRYLDGIGDCGDLSEAANRLSLSIDQACGTDLGGVLEERWMARKSGAWKIWFH